MSILACITRHAAWHLGHCTTPAHTRPWTTIAALCATAAVVLTAAHYDTRSTS